MVPVHHWVTHLPLRSGHLALHGGEQLRLPLNDRLRLLQLPLQARRLGGLLQRAPQQLAEFLYSITARISGAVASYSLSLIHI